MTEQHDGWSKRTRLTKWPDRICRSGRARARLSFRARLKGIASTETGILLATRR